MTALTRWMGVSLATGMAAACATQSVSTVPRPVAPQEGPQATVYTTVTGGLLNRRLDASFKVDQTAWVVVGHLGADGSMHILYPKDPSDARPVKGGTRVRTGQFGAGFDGTHRLLFASGAGYRSPAAMRDSYDGTGHSFVFMITSKMPFVVNAISTGREWDDLDVADYAGGMDPRLAVRNLADALTAGAPYTISYATSFNTISFSDYASAYECSLFAASRIGFYYWWTPYAYYDSYYSPTRSLERSCRGSLNYAYLAPSRRVAVTWTVTQPRDTTPTPKATTRAWRPGTTNPRRNTASAFTERYRPSNPFAESGGRSGTSGGAGTTVARTTAGNETARASAPAPTRDSQGNAPKTKQ